MWKVLLELATHVPMPALYTTLLVPAVLSEGVCTPLTLMPFPVHDPPAGEPVSCKVPALLQRGAMGVMVGVGGLLTTRVRVAVAEAQAAYAVTV